MVSSASVSEQLAYWIGQTSTLSDSLIESQLRRSEAEAIVERLLPLERNAPAVQAEMRALSEARAAALVENARLSEWAESLRQLTHQQEAELAQLRHFSAQQESGAAALSAQLSAAQSAGSSLTGALQLQQAYQAKLATSEAALAAAQKEVAELATIKFNYQVLHAKYTALKRDRAGAEQRTRSEHHALEGELESTRRECAAYRAQMTTVCDELEAVRQDLLARETERERLLTGLVTGAEKEQSLLSENTRLRAVAAHLRHAMRVIRARAHQQVDQMRDALVQVRRETAQSLELEHRGLQVVCSEVLTQLRRSQSRAQSTQQLLETHLREERELHQHQLQAADEKMMQLLQYSTGGAAAAAQLQHRKALLAKSQQLVAAAATQTQTQAQDTTTTHAVQPAAQVAPSPEFDVRSWLQKQNTLPVPTPSPAPAPAPASTTDANSAAHQPHPYSTHAHASLPLDSYISRSGANHVAAASIGESPQAAQPVLPPHAAATMMPPTFSLPASVASSILPPHSVRGGGVGDVSALPSAFASQAPSQLSSAVPSPFLQPQQPTNVAHTFHHAAPHNSTGVTIAGEFVDHLRAHSDAAQLTRSVHVQRLAEVEAALRAMEEVHVR